MRLLYTLLTLIVCSVMLLAYKPAVAAEAVASVKKIKGPVDVQRRNTTIAARTGLILHDKDLVVTHERSRITIIFRDGSEIRLFPNTKFLIEKSHESPEGPRRFLHNFKLKLGSFWGKFSRNYQKTTIVTPTATVGIKGTTVALSERDAKLDVTLSTGKVQITNQTESVELTAGNVAEEIAKEGSIGDKIKPLHYQIVIKGDQKRVTIPSKGNEKELFFTLQLVDVRTNKNVERTGAVYISIATENIVFADNIRLNPRGYARIKAKVLAPEKINTRIDRVEIFALMDGEEYMDVRAGSTTLILDYDEATKKKLKIDARSGKLKK